MIFTINNITNKDLNFKIKNSNHLTKPKKKIEIIDIPGRTGALIIDDGSRENFTLKIQGYIDARRNNDLKTICNELDKWLNGTTGYQTMTFDDGTTLKVVFIGEINPEYITRMCGELTLEFSAYHEVIE
ncbi:Phage-related protein [uncultured Clostridium sp.]|nr:Phage-related protein [uncultured Clostridium sp.]